MIVLSVDLSVKFRALFTDLYKFNHSWQVAVPFPAPPGFTDHSVLKYDDRGVKLNVAFKVIS